MFNRKKSKTAPAQEAAQDPEQETTQEAAREPEQQQEPSEENSESIGEIEETVTENPDYPELYTEWVATQEATDDVKLECAEKGAAILKKMREQPEVLFEAIYRGVNYPRAVAEATLRGRNEGAMQRIAMIAASDGLPHPESAGALPPKKQKNSIFDLVRGAR